DMEGDVTTTLVALYKKLWMSLSELLQKLGSAYSRTYSTLSLFLLTNVTIAAYGFTSEVIDHGFTFTFKEMGLLVDFAYSMGLLFTICDCSHKASEYIAKRVQTTLLNIRLSKVDVTTSEEIQIFLMAIQMNPP
ncbi:gustatory and odorant receptor 21a-like, partial [Agrilus planipennis]